ncbi:hypothetical protein [Lewinella sp. 4G2]|uniref:DUF6962 family protein n=1 Tax=Lewinella sp. 4G2 TaxID=1803372 RepID=UPI0007B4C7F3|nr:hypothetical protein [Lewinella sp. 4G2]OAV45198.1 hypothetical protein A3850_012150 [Lewinella sp. 4G2]
MFSPTQLIALSDFALAACCLFMSGWLFGRLSAPHSRPGLLCFFMLFAGAAPFLGGVDHGFFEPLGARFIPRLITYLMIAAGTFCLFRYTILTYLPNARKVLMPIAFLQLVGFVAASFLTDNFLLVIGNFTPVLVLFVAMNLLQRKAGPGRTWLATYGVVMTAASLIQALGIAIPGLLDADTFSHLVALASYAFFFLGARDVIHAHQAVPKGRPT